MKRSMMPWTKGTRCVLSCCHKQHVMCHHPYQAFCALLLSMAVSIA